MQILVSLMIFISYLFHRFTQAASAMLRAHSFSGSSQSSDNILLLLSSVFYSRGLNQKLPGRSSYSQRKLGVVRVWTNRIYQGFYQSSFVSTIYRKTLVDHKSAFTCLHLFFVWKVYFNHRKWQMLFWIALFDCALAQFSTFRDRKQMHLIIQAPTTPTSLSQEAHWKGWPECQYKKIKANYYEKRWVKYTK